MTDLDVEQAMTLFPPGIYQHYKGHLYQLLHLARDSENGPSEGRLLVVYIGLELAGARPGPRICVRPLEEFGEWLPEPDGSGVHRFTFLAAEWSPSLLEEGL